ncbi:MAG TPA: hypothetical protein VF784_12780 [Anaerolineales bacterium]
MSRSRVLKLTLCLTVLLLFAQACDLGSLLPGAGTGPGSAPAASSPGAQFPSTIGTTGPFRPSAAGWIAFTNKNNIWLIHPDGSGLKQITRNAVTSGSGLGAFSLEWSPDGQFLAYSRADRLWVLDINSLATTVRATSTAGGFDWSSTAEQIIYDGSLTTSGSGQPSNNGLWITDVTSGQTVSLFKSPATEPAMLAPRWSPDSSRVIFSEPSGARPGGIHLLNLLTDNITDLMPGSSSDTTCRWSRIDLLIACIDGNPAQGQTPGVVFFDQDGKQTRVVPLPAGHAHARLGPWSVDGGRLTVIYSTDAGGSQLMTDILTLASGEFKTLGSGSASDWSSDGRWIVMAGPAGSGDQAGPPLTVVNTTSGLSSALTNGSTAMWQPSAADTGVVSAATQRAYCLSTAVGFVYRKQKGHFLEFCVGAKRYTYGALEEGVYAMGPRAAYFVYVSNSGYIFAARVGDPALTAVGDVRNFIAIRTVGMVPEFLIRFIPSHPELVQIVEQHFHEDETFTLPSRITSP